MIKMYSVDEFIERSGFNGVSMAKICGITKAAISIRKNAGWRVTVGKYGALGECICWLPPGEKHYILTPINL